MIRARLVWNKGVTQADKAEAFAACEADLAAFRKALGDNTALIWPTIVQQAP